MIANEAERGRESFWISFIDVIGLLATVDEADEADAVFWSDFCWRSRSVRPRDGVSCKRDPMSILNSRR